MCNEESLLTFKFSVIREVLLFPVISFSELARFLLQSIASRTSQCGSMVHYTLPQSLAEVTRAADAELRLHTH